MDFWSLSPRHIMSVVPLFSMYSTLLWSVSIIFKANVARQHRLGEKKRVSDYWGENINTATSVRISSFV